MSVCGARQSCITREESSAKREEAINLIDSRLMLDYIVNGTILSKISLQRFERCTMKHRSNEIAIFPRHKAGLELLAYNYRSTSIESCRQLVLPHYGRKYQAGDPRVAINPTLEILPKVSKHNSGAGSFSSRYVPPEWR